MLILRRRTPDNFIGNPCIEYIITVYCQQDSELVLTRLEQKLART